MKIELSLYVAIVCLMSLSLEASELNITVLPKEMQNNIFAYLEDTKALCCVSKDFPAISTMHDNIKERALENAKRDAQSGEYYSTIQSSFYTKLNDLYNKSCVNKENKNKDLYKENYDTFYKKYFEPHHCPFSVFISENKNTTFGNIEITVENYECKEITPNCIRKKITIAAKNPYVYWIYKGESLDGFLELYNSQNEKPERIIFLSDNLFWTQILNSFLNNKENNAFDILNANTKILQDKNGLTVLHALPYPSVYKRNKRSLETLMILLKTNLHIRDNEQRTPFFLACAKGCKDLANLYIQNGTRLNTQRVYLIDRVQTPLDAAVLCGHIEIVRLLINEGVDINISDDEGETALGQILRVIENDNRNNELENDFLERNKIMAELLINNGAQSGMKKIETPTKMRNLAIAGSIVLGITALLAIKKIRPQFYDPLLRFFAWRSQ